VDGDAHRVQVFDGAGTFLAKLGTPGSGNGGLLDPWDVTVGPSGDVYVNDGGNGRIQRFSAPIP
jgi:tripartite motif-containing protein 71